MENNEAGMVGLNSADLKVPASKSQQYTLVSLAENQIHTNAITHSIARNVLIWAIHFYVQKYLLATLDLTGTGLI